MKFILYFFIGDNVQASKDFYTKDIDDPEAWSRKTVDWFNSTLRPGERPREFVQNTSPIWCVGCRDRIIKNTPHDIPLPWVGGWILR